MNNLALGSRYSQRIRPGRLIHKVPDSVRSIPFPLYFSTNSDCKVCKALKCRSTRLLRVRTSVVGELGRALEASPRHIPKAARARRGESDGVLSCNMNLDAD